MDASGPYPEVDAGEGAGFTAHHAGVQFTKYIFPSGTGGGGLQTPPPRYDPVHAAQPIF